MAPLKKRVTGAAAAQPQRTIASFFTSPRPGLRVAHSSDGTRSTTSELDGPFIDHELQIAVQTGSRASPVVSSTTSESLLQGTTTGSRPELVIGKKLQVYWPLDKRWYAGCIKSYNAKLGKHVVEYEDGEEESLVLDDEKVIWLSGDDDESRGVGNGSGFRLSGKGQRRRQSQEPKDGGKKGGGQLKGCNPSQRKTRGQVTYDDDKGTDEEEDASDDDDDEDDVDFQNETEESDDDEDNDSASDGDTDGENSDEDDEDLAAHKKPKRLAKQTTPPPVKRKRRLIKKSGAALSTIAGGTVDVQGKSETPANGATKLSQRGSKTSTDVLLVGTPIPLCGEAAERFGGRNATKFKFLGKDRKDAAGRRPSDPAYDSRTLHLPTEFVNKLSGGQRQWWEFKAKHMDKVLLFKMGKFYEMFEMDAHIGAKDLDLQYMKGEQPHCGFPEKNFTDNAEKLARKGHRVLVVEQTETPDQLERRRKETGSKDKVVMREVCAVITKGTLVDGDMVAVSSAPLLMFSLTECCLPEGASMIGVCVVDASTSCFQLGQFEDDATRTCLCSLLSELRPVELITPRGQLSSPTLRALRDHTRQPLVNDLTTGSEFWDAQKSLEEIMKVYSHLRSLNEKVAAQEDVLPEVLRHVVEAGKKGELALSAMGASVYYLRQALLDQTLLAVRRIELLPGRNNIVSTASSKESHELMRGEIDVTTRKVEPHMVLDAAALENLEVLENRDGGTSGTLLARLDHCATRFGRRLLRSWLARPLLQVKSIQQRQTAIKDLKGVGAEAAISFKKALAGVPDMERLLAQLHGSSGAKGRNAANVVMYEDVSKRQVHQFTAALRGCRAMLQAVTAFSTCLPSFLCPYLRDLLTLGKGMPKMKSLLQHLERAFDWAEAEKSGRIMPHEGVDDDFDAAATTITEVEKKLAAYLEQQRKHFNNSSEIVYLTVGKDTYQMEVPDRFLDKVPADFEVRSSRKGFRRYWSPQIKELVQELATGHEHRELALRGILLRLVQKFCKNYPIWLSAVQAVAEVDVLVSIASAGTYGDGPTCTPTFKEAEQVAPWFDAKGLRHPTLGDTFAGGTSFVPNDVKLGGTSHSPFMLLTGPNMGGKSTLLRQVCLAVILAQVGSDVPAERLELSPVDQMFVRMGARDQIMAGQSTFLVELLETATMLRSATKHSLVALDELGRGTATSDGQAIAHAVLHKLAHEVCCRGMFSTHYHHLATDHSADPTVELYHMACEVASTPGGSEEVTFLYKLVMGACPKSYGVNVARLAGMPESILQRASSRSAQLELAFECNDKKEITDKVVDLSEEELLKELQHVFKKSQMCDHDPIILRRLLLLWEQGKQVITDNGTNWGSQPTPGCTRENHSNFSKRQESPIRSCY
ncbi:hypothetical protein CY35_09G025900 [Sphagnum magellanicum]|nr:hypothetical protein CY35_09G025900 [Sphagnum magellanicum]KAH9551683.1 hypothetical protein CY35_09G025900 [Sphagnum magellanicum]